MGVLEQREKTTVFWIHGGFKLERAARALQAPYSLPHFTDRSTKEVWRRRGPVPSLAACWQQGSLRNQVSWALSRIPPEDDGPEGKKVGSEIIVVPV